MTAAAAAFLALTLSSTSRSISWSLAEEDMEDLEEEEEDEKEDGGGWAVEEEEEVVVEGLWTLTFGTEGAELVLTSVPGAGPVIHAAPDPAATPRRAARMKKLAMGIAAQERERIREEGSYTAIRRINPVNRVNGRVKKATTVHTAKRIPQSRLQKRARMDRAALCKTGGEVDSVPGMGEVEAERVVVAVVVVVAVTVGSAWAEMTRMVRQARVRKRKWDENFPEEKMRRLQDQGPLLAWEWGWAMGSMWARMAMVDEGGRRMGLFFRSSKAGMSSVATKGRV